MISAAKQRLWQRAADVTPPRGAYVELSHDGVNVHDVTHWYPQNFSRAKMYWRYADCRALPKVGEN